MRGILRWHGLGRGRLTRAALWAGSAAALTAVALAVVYLYGVWVQSKAVARLCEVGADVLYDDGSRAEMIRDIQSAPPGRPITRDFLHHPTGLQLYLDDEDSFTPSLAETIGRLRGLKWLFIPEPPPPQIDFSFLRRLTKLEMVAISDLRILPYLENARGLSDLSCGPDWDPDDCHGEFWTPDQRAALGRLRQLTWVTLGMNDLDMVALKGLDRLEVVSLWGPRLYGAGLVNLRCLPTLTNLTLDRTPLRDENLRFLAGAHSLHDLSLLETPIQGTGLRFLSQLENLKYLQLGGTKVDDDALAHLLPLRALRSLYVGGTRVTEAGVKRFHAARPDVSVSWGDGVKTHYFIDGKY